MNGTSGEAAASDHKRAFGRNNLNCTNQANAATRTANRNRPERASGVVFGSEIMKNANRSSEPLSNRCRGIVIGSPICSERKTRIAAHADKKAKVTSARCARVTTTVPRQASRKPKVVALPHWPDETHTRSVTASIATNARFVGLKTCFPLERTTNLLPTATIAATAANHGAPVRSSRHKDRDEMSALFHSTRKRPTACEAAACVRRAAAIVTTTWVIPISKSSPIRPYVRSEPNTAIW